MRIFFGDSAEMDAWGELRCILQQVISTDLKVEPRVLRAEWKSGFDPERDLFVVKFGVLRSKWRLTPEVWEKVGDAYLRWTLVTDDKQKRRFWKLAEASLRKTADWSVADAQFKEWLRKKH